MNKVIIMGPIDTVEEVNLLLDFFQRKGLLVQNREFANESVLLLRTLQERRQQQLYGCVDTPGEIQLFMKVMRENKKFVGAIDTPEELQLIKELGEAGLLGPRYEAPSINPNPVNKLKP